MINYFTMLKNLCIFTLVYHNFVLIGYNGCLYWEMLLIVFGVITDFKV